MLLFPASIKSVTKALRCRSDCLDARARVPGTYLCQNVYLIKQPNTCPETLAYTRR
jgi:hypothetical protein